MAQKALDRGSDHEAEDVVQEVLLRLLRYLPTLRATRRGEMVNYLNRTLRGVVSELYRRRTTAKRTWRESGEPSPERADPEEELLREEGYLRLLERLAGRAHPERDRLIVYLAAVEGCSSEEIATRVGLSPSGVASAFHRLRVRHREGQTGPSPAVNGCQRP